MQKNFRTYHLAVSFFRLTRELKLGHVLSDQLTRASSSIVLNLAEGGAKSSKKDRKRFFEIALGSLRESQAILDLAHAGPKYTQLADRLGANLYCLIKSLI